MSHRGKLPTLLLSNGKCLLRLSQGIQYFYLLIKMTLHLFSCNIKLICSRFMQTRRKENTYAFYGRSFLWVMSPRGIECRVSKGFKLILSQRYLSPLPKIKQMKNHRIQWNQQARGFLLLANHQFRISHHSLSICQ